MIVSSAFRGKRYAVLGLARSGMATVETLLASGAEVVAWDRQDGPRDELAGRATIADPLAIDLAGFAAVVLSPGVPLNTHPIADKARAAGVPLIGDIELFAQARPTLPAHKVVGITGTNGKSTTTASKPARSISIGSPIAAMAATASRGPGRRSHAVTCAPLACRLATVASPERARPSTA